MKTIKFSCKDWETGFVLPYLIYVHIGANSFRVICRGVVMVDSLSYPNMDAEASARNYIETVVNGACEIDN